MEKFSAEESYKRMAEFVRESGVSDSRQVTSSIAKACGVSFQAATKWKDGLTKSVTMPPINEFCEKYGANPDYISSGRLPRTRSGSASKEFSELLQLFEAADEEGRQHLMQTARLVGRRDNREKN